MSLPNFVVMLIVNQNRRRYTFLPRVTGNRTPFVFCLKMEKVGRA